MKITFLKVHRRKKLSPREDARNGNSSSDKASVPVPKYLSWNERRLVRKSWKKAEKVVVDAGVEVFIK